MSIQTPLGNSESIKIRDLPKDLIIKELSYYYNLPAPPDAVDTDYSLWRCSKTGMEFSFPLKGGNKEFYQWISSFPNYYPINRWEYRKVDKLIKNGEKDKNNFKILDIGCGDGNFLDSLKWLNPSNKYAMDFNESAVQACINKGYHSFNGTIESGMATGFVHHNEFDIVTSFHCLEHVPDPLAFVRELMSVVSSGGKLFLSTPYSPMSFEENWFDVMNHPPHHMTRWNLQAYQELAKILGVNMKYYVPNTIFVKQLLNRIILNKYGPNRNIKLWQVLKDCVLNPFKSINHYISLKRRASQSEVAGADVILVEFYR